MPTGNWTTFSPMATLYASLKGIYPTSLLGSNSFKSACSGMNWNREDISLLDGCCSSVSIYWVAFWKGKPSCNLVVVPEVTLQLALFLRVSVQCKGIQLGDWQSRTPRAWFSEVCSAGAAILPWVAGEAGFQSRSVTTVLHKEPPVSLAEKEERSIELLWGYRAIRYTEEVEDQGNMPYGDKSSAEESPQRNNENHCFF